MNNEDVIDKIKKVSHTIAVLLKICQIASYIGLVFLAVIMIYMGINQGLNPIVKSDNLTIQAPLSKEILMSMGLKNLYLICIITGIKMGLYLGVFIVSRKIFAEVSVNDTPFEMVHVKRMRMISIMMLVANIICVTAQSYGISWGIDAAGIIGSFIIWGFSNIFEYGCRLQQESDETL